MIILIGGASRTGKTLLAQRLLEEHHYPYTSIDHIKMGLFRGYADCGFTPLDNDALISRKLWGVIKGIVDTCLENKQNIILEGCCLPPEKVRTYDESDVVCLYIVFSQQYIENNFAAIVNYENSIEKRRFPEDLGKDACIADNAAVKASCLASGVSYIEIQENYEREMLQAQAYIRAKMAARHHRDQAAPPMP